MQEIADKDFELFNEVVEMMVCEDQSEKVIKRVMNDAEKAGQVATALLEITLADMDLSARNIDEVMSQISILCKLENFAGMAVAMRIFEMIPFERDMGNLIK
jgi:predicted amino acid racemase